MKYQSVIVTYNRKNKLIEAVNSLLNQTEKPIRIILIDNHSTDGTKQLLETLGFLDNPRIKYLQMPKNYGGSGGFYYGIKEAMKYKDFDFLSLSDDDAIYKFTFFELISKYQQAHPNIKAFSGTVQYEDGTIQIDHRRRILDDRWYRQDDIPITEYHQNFEVDLLSFVGCVISRDILEKIGLPEKDYFIYYDDTEYSLRIRKYSKIINVSNAIIVHKTPKKDPAKQNVITWKNYYELRNSMLMKKKHSNWKWLRFYFYQYYIKLSIRILFNKVYKGQRKEAFYIYNQAFKDALKNRKGKNKLFMP
ncbi:glycosyltransferase [Limosilactobacillus caviae]|uniref:Glycosyl transferase family 2 n=1 Tax=Limosilactobacillus caviae TaxID=1769424 RepID=A0ABQ2CA06_9LACO|nr:glycosyltransferase [Limosilactobacillus caviae]MCD7124498.1 glycosyltransferase [Limosilactobacillus caviae]MRH46265.1 glycosyltransferase [Limosilactobacillus reuteri]GGI63594.1 glycosyl transferase family 2 [Limosilactobacillus caviae]